MLLFLLLLLLLLLSPLPLLLHIICHHHQGQHHYNHHNQQCQACWCNGDGYLKISRVQLKCNGTRWRMGEEVKGKLANGVSSQYSSHYLETWCIQHYYRWCAHLGLPVVNWTDAPRQIKWTRPFCQKMKSGFCACTITFQMQSTWDLLWSYLF